jgi:hypothetical protein
MLFEEETMALYQCAKLRKDFDDLEATAPCTKDNYKNSLTTMLTPKVGTEGFGEASKYGGAAGDYWYAPWKSE